MIETAAGWVKSRKAGWVLAALLLFAAAIRLLAIQARGFQYDDVFSIFLAQRGLGDIVQGTAADTMPPLYYFLLHFWLMVSAQPAWIRLLSVFFSVLAVFLTYLLVRRLFGGPAAFGAALLVAISPFQFYHAQDVRNYALLLCCQLGYMLSWVVIWQREEAKERAGWRAWAGLVICGGLAMYTHNAAAFGLIVPDVVLFFSRRWKQLGRLIAAQAGIAVLALPWLLLLPGQIAKVQRAWWQAPPGLVELLQIPIVWTSGLPLPGVWLAVGLFLGVGVLALLALAVVKAGRPERGVAMLLALVAVIPAAMFAASYLVKPIFVPRAFILASAGYCGLAGWAIARYWQAGLGKVIAAGFLLAALVGLPAQITFADFPRSPFQTAAGELASRMTPNSLVIHDNKLSYFPFRFYQPGLSQRFIADEPGSGNDTFAYGSQVAMDIFPDASLEQAAGAKRSIYFVVFTETIQEYLDMGKAAHPSIEWLQAHYTQTNHWIYHDLEILQFEKP